MEQLDGRVAVITGGGSGIGEGLAHACHAAGMKLVVSDIEQAQAERVAEAVRALGGEAVAVRTDVTDQVRRTRPTAPCTWSAATPAS